MGGVAMRPRNPRPRQPFGMPTGRRTYSPSRVYAGSERGRIIVLSVIVLLGGLCLYSIIFSHLLQDITLGPNPSADQIAVFNKGVGRIPICVLPVTLLAFIALLLYVIEAILHRAPRRMVCPRCGT